MRGVPVAPRGVAVGPRTRAPGGVEERRLVLGYQRRERAQQRLLVALGRGMDQVAQPLRELVFVVTGALDDADLVERRRERRLAGSDQLFVELLARPEPGE